MNDWAPSGQPIDQALAEFFILRKYRRNGVGRRAANELLVRLPGTWELAVTDYNKPALGFWRRVVGDLADFTVTEMVGDGNRWKGPIFRLAPVR